MKQKICIILLGTLFFGFKGYGSTGPEDRVAETTQVQTTNPLSSGGIYELKQKHSFRPQGEYIDGQWVDSDDDTVIGLEALETLSAEFVNANQVVITLTPSPLYSNEVPDQFVVSREEFDQADLRFLESGTADDLIAKYSPYQEEKMAARNGGTSGKHRMRYKGYGGCLAYVCKRVGCSGTIGNGKGMTRNLKKRGWKKTSCSNPPKDAVASWSGGPRGSGHTAIWNGRGWCFDQGCFDPGKKFRLIECVRR